MLPMPKNIKKGKVHIVEVLATFGAVTVIIKMIGGTPFANTARFVRNATVKTSDGCLRCAPFVGKLHQSPVQGFFSGIDVDGTWMPLMVHPIRNSTLYILQTRDEFTILRSSTAFTSYRDLPMHRDLLEPTVLETVPLPRMRHAFRSAWPARFHYQGFFDVIHTGEVVTSTSDYPSDACRAASFELDFSFSMLGHRGSESLECWTLLEGFDDVWVSLDFWLPLESPPSPLSTFDITLLVVLLLVYVASCAVRTPRQWHREGMSSLSIVSEDSLPETTGNAETTSALTVRGLGSGLEREHEANGCSSDCLVQGEATDAVSLRQDESVTIGMRVQL